MALGIVALYLGIAIGISTWLRPRIGYTWWRRLHILTLGVYALATAHWIGTGSDTQTWWALAIYVISGVLVGSLLCWRLMTATSKRKKHTPSPAPSRRADAAPQSAPRTLNGAGAVASSGQGQKQREVARVR
jgi:predicted ferric reductase